MSPCIDGQKTYICLYLTRECLKYIAANIDIFRETIQEENLKGNKKTTNNTIVYIEL